MNARSARISYLHHDGDLPQARSSGMDRIFNQPPIFRNEGMDSSHSPGIHGAGAMRPTRTNGMADLTRDLIQQAARDAFDLSEGEMCA